MKGRLFLLIVAIVFGYFPAAAGAEAPPEGQWYGDSGTLEYGLGGSFSVNGSGTSMFVISPFLNYFPIGDLHFGLTVTYMHSATDTQPLTQADLWHFLPSVGYTLPLNPRLMLDVSGNAGWLTETVSSGSASVQYDGFSYGLMALILAPLSEHLVLGIGVAGSWYSLKDKTGKEYKDQLIWIPFRISGY